MDFAKAAFLVFSILGIAWWVGTVMKAEGDDKLLEACHPVVIVTDSVIKVTTGLTGFTPNWTLGTKRVLEGGCYYFFETFLFSDMDEGLEGELPAEGGVRTK